MYYQANSLKDYATEVLATFGCDEREQQIVSEHLVDANLCGHDSHGIGMLPMYGEQVIDGTLIPNQVPEFHPSQGAVSIVDARRGFGHRMALLALDHAMQQIEQHRVSILALRNSGHVSRVGNYGEYCASKGYVSLHFVNVVGHPPFVAPFGAAQSGFSTNPVCMAMPIDGKTGPLLDMATSTVAFGKVRVASNKGEIMPAGCLVDEAGLDTCDPNPMALEHRGSLTAFGAHKGSGIGIFVELLAGALASDHTVATQPHLQRGVINNMLSIIIDPSALDEREDIDARTRTFAGFIKGLKPAADVDQVLLPGEPENISRAQRARHGIPVDPNTIDQITEIVSEFREDAATLTGLLKPVG